MHEPGLVERVCQLNAAVSDPNRMKMIKILGSHPEHTVSVSDVARLLGISQPTATKHLKLLHAVGFIRRRRIQNAVYYSLDEDTITEYHRLMEYAFAHATTPCVNAYDCETCSFRATCV